MRSIKGSILVNNPKALMMKNFFDSIHCFDGFIINQNESLFSQEWYSGTTSENWIPYYKRNPKRARFTLEDRGVCYFANDCARIDFEIGDYFKSHKITSSSPDFNHELWPRMTGQVQTEEKTQEIKGAFKINASAKIFDLNTDLNINNLNNLWNQYSRNIGNLILDIVMKREEAIYELSSYFAEQVFKKEFDGILYRPANMVSNILGPINNPMLVLFEPKRHNRRLFHYYHSGNILRANE